MFGAYGAGEELLPRVLHISIARYRQDAPVPGHALEFLVSIHEEGTGISWIQNVIVDPQTEQYFLDTVLDLHRWSLNRALTAKEASERIRQLGARLYTTFIGPHGDKALTNLEPTAILLNVDETTLNLPWELIGADGDALAARTPFGRLVTTRVLPRVGRDPLEEDRDVRILAVANPTSDLAVTEAEVSALAKLEGDYGGYRLKVDVLSRRDATCQGFAERLVTGDYDILHFAGHAVLDSSKPEESSLHFADGTISATDVFALPWKTPPYFVFNSACESAGAVGGRRLVTNENHSNGLAAAFLATGVYGYAGYFWPVTDSGAGLFAETFYRALFARENLGLAFRDARAHAIQELSQHGDLTGYSAVLFGDAASKHRRDFAMAV